MGSATGVFAAKLVALMVDEAIEETARYCGVELNDGDKAVIIDSLVARDPAGTFTEQEVAALDPG